MPNVLLRASWSLLFAFLATAGFAQPAQPKPSGMIRAVTADSLIARALRSDTVFVINFWATWCGPCVKELPEFSKLARKYSDKPVKVLLVSLDFKESYPIQLKTYVTRKKIEEEVLWFSETEPNVFIPKIDASWTGALPATLILNRKKKAHFFLEKSVTAAELSTRIEPLLKTE